MVEIVLGIAFFTGIVLLLVAVILLARARLVPSGDVDLVVNDGTTIRVPVGGKLLQALTTAGVHFPAACSGSGICGLCRVKVQGENVPVLPTEKARLSRRDIAQGTHLACQVTIREDLAIEVPEEVFGVQTWTCRVRSSSQVAGLIREVILEMPAGQRIDFRAGSYVQITCPPYHTRFADFDIDETFRADWDRFDLWRHAAGTAKPVTRAYSMANPPAEADVITLNIRVAIPPPNAPDAPAGVVSSYLFNLKPGDEVAVSGPYGHFFTADSEAEMIFVGGGVGMAPMRAHILDLLERRGSKRRIGFWYGTRNRREIFYRDTFDALAAEHDNFDWHVALSEPLADGGWDGRTGFIHDVLLADYLDDHPAPEDCEYYLCGPPLMIKAVQRMLDNLGVDPDNIYFDDFGG